SFDIQPDRRNFLKVLARKDLNSQLERIVTRTVAALELHTAENDVALQKTRQEVISALGFLGVQASWDTNRQLAVLGSTAFVKNMLRFIDSWEQIKERVTGKF
ncbi:MAG: hypothetical protein KDD62_07365, partial [Bdellovibrionales bacterium]|nr:hypothetical protein [Bdellovibrionales bacterium]